MPKLYLLSNAALDYMIQNCLAPETWQPVRLSCKRGLCKPATPCADVCAGRDVMRPARIMPAALVGTGFGLPHYRFSLPLTCAASGLYIEIVSEYRRYGNDSSLSV